MKEFEAYFDQEAIVAAGRSKRPFIKKEDLNCPFCAEHLGQLEKVIMEKWENDRLWVCIVPNKYPIIQGSGKGYHDVIIDTADHVQRPKDFSLAHWEVLLLTIQQRWQTLVAKDAALSFIQLFKNDGEAAGASISHSHWQMVALAQIPLKVAKRYDHYLKMTQQRGCYLCQLTAEKEGFLIKENKRWWVWVPPEPEYNGEVWLIPKRHCQHYGELTTDEIKCLGPLMRGILKGYESLQPQSAYNICFMSGDIKGKWSYHFYIKMMMRSGRIAGFELATSCHIITCPPAIYEDQLKKTLKGI